MTPKEKAEDLIKEFMPYQDDYYNDEPRDGAISCALIAVDEVLKSQRNIYGVNNKATKFYLEVKEELEKL
jgi:hypothetical protein